ncbi:pupal cuticle protein-like [Toxorhynchites rutilus septentrionalis]|uniref:pupal cuticle protein-like n=1 Tax=Toxorhynchites rutilus septentrionalis TaxID=329112 RepID=UPI00247A5BD9|nr:pupal cuticle protein-like [Toxorhynchites rutilus septentrionalis]
MMRAFVLGSVLLLASACSASHWGHDSPATHWDHYASGHNTWHGPQHYPVIVKGVPVETPEVQHAKAAHTAAHAKVAKYDQYTPIHESTNHHAKSFYSSQHVPVIKNGVPVETPEVQHAKALHAAAHAKAAKYDTYAPVHGDYYGRSYGLWHDFPAIKNGFPVETPEVQHAKAAHFAAHLEAKARLHKRSAYSAPLVHVPLDTPEVAAAKAAHFAAHAAAKTGHGSPAAHWDHYAPEQRAWHGPLHYPVIVKGVPVETPEVQHAKATHAAAYAKVASTDRYIPIHEDQYARNYDSWHGSQYVPVVIKNGVPVETPEVQHAKAVFLRAHASASVHSRSYGHDDDDGSYKPELYDRVY